MPLYEYSCSACGKEFELLVRHDTEATCSACGSADIKKLLSLPTMKSSGAHELAMRAAKKRDAAQGKEQLRAQIEYEKNHD